MSIDLVDFLPAVSRETALDILEHRQTVVKRKLTSRAAKAINKELLLIPESQRDDAVNEWLNRGWQGFKAAWYYRSIGAQMLTAVTAKGIAGAALNYMGNGNGQSFGGGSGNDVERVPSISKH